MAEDKQYSISHQDLVNNDQHFIRSDDKEREASIGGKSHGSKKNQPFIQTDEDLRYTKNSRHSTDYDLVQSNKHALSHDKNYNPQKVEKYLNMDDKDADIEDELNDRSYPLPDDLNTESKLNTIQEKSHEASNDITLNSQFMSSKNKFGAGPLELNNNVRSSIKDYQHQLYKPHENDIQIEYAENYDEVPKDSEYKLEPSVRDYMPETNNNDSNVIRIDLIRAKRKIELLEKRVGDVEDDTLTLKKTHIKSGSNIVQLDKLDEIINEQNRQKAKIDELERYQTSQANKISLLKRFNECEKDNLKLYSPVSHELYRKKRSVSTSLDKPEHDLKQISNRSKKALAKICKNQISTTLISGFKEDRQNQENVANEMDESAKNYNVNEKPRESVKPDERYLSPSPE